MAKKPTKSKRPMGSVRAARKEKKRVRALEVGAQVAERTRRTQTAKGKVRQEYKQRVSSERPGFFVPEVVRPKAQWFEAKVGARVEKRLYRFRGPDAFDNAADVLIELRDDRPRWKTYVQIGEGYHAGARWVGSRVDTPEETSAWLQGVGTTYLKKGSIFAKKKRSELWVEVVALRPVPKGKRAASVLRNLGDVLPAKKTKKRRKAKGKRGKK